MSKLMFVFGVLFLAIGLAIGLKVYFSPGQMQIYGLTAEVVSILLVGGVLSLGLGGLIWALDDGANLRVAVDASTLQAGMTPTATPKFAGSAAKAAETKAETENPSLRPSVTDTVIALEQAKSDIARALEIKPVTMNDARPLVDAPQAPVIEAKTQAAAAVEEEAEENDLYVVEEKVIRGRPARVLSDGTVEAETDEGWMRFENLEHLNEYIDAMAPEA